MKKIFSSLPVKLLIGIVIGIIFGQIFPENVMSVVVPLKNILGQVINFVVPLIVIGFIAPSITKLGNNASRMLGVALMVAYTSSVLAQHFFLWELDMQLFRIFRLCQRLKA